MSRSVREVETFRERDRESPPRNRWDRDRFDFYSTQPQARERDIDIRISESRSPPGAAAPVLESDRRTVVEERDRTIERDGGRFVERDRDRFVERDRYGPEGGRRYWEEPTLSEINRGALMPYRGGYEQSRPRMLRRQSSLDTFDRRPYRYEHDDWRPPSYVPHALPYRGGGGRGYDPYYEDYRFRERERERDFSPGWEEEYRDVRVRRKRGKGGRRRHRERERSLSISSSSSSSSDSKSVTTVKSSRTAVERESITLIGKKGKTRMPKRLVHKQAIIDLGLPFEEEEHFIIVKRALEKDHIDDVIKRSEGFRDTTVKYKFEEVKTGGFEEEKVSEEIDTKSVSTVGPALSIAPSHRSHRSRSRAGSVRDEFFEKKTEIIESDHVDRRSDRSIRDEIKALEAEREALRLERRADRRLIEAERRDDREEVLFVEKDRRGRKYPDPKAVAFAMSTLT